MARRLLRPQFSAACRNVLQEAIKVVMCVIMYRFVNAFYGPSAAAALVTAGECANRWMDMVHCRRLLNTQSKIGCEL